MNTIQMLLPVMLADTPASPAANPTPVAPTAGPAPAVTNPGLSGLGPTTTGATGTKADGAQPIGPNPQMQQQAPQQPSGSMMILLLPLVLIIALVWFQSRTMKKEQQKKAEMLSGLNTNDKVQTAGGIIGFVAEIRDDEVVLRVDEASNTRIRFSKAAIVGVLNRSRSASGVTEAKPNGAGSKAGV